MNLWLPEGKGGIVKEFGIDMYTVIYLKWITDKDLLYSQKKKKKRWHMKRFFIDYIYYQEFQIRTIMRYH